MRIKVVIPIEEYFFIQAFLDGLSFTEVKHESGGSERDDIKVSFLITEDDIVRLLTRAYAFSRVEEALNSLIDVDEYEGDPIWKASLEKAQFYTTYTD